MRLSLGNLTGMLVCSARSFHHLNKMVYRGRRKELLHLSYSILLQQLVNVERPGFHSCQFLSLLQFLVKQSECQRTAVQNALVAHVISVVHVVFSALRYKKLNLFAYSFNP